WLVGLGVGDLDLHPRERVAHGVEPYLNPIACIGYRTVAVALGQAVDIADLVCTEVHDHLHGLWGTNSGPRSERAQVDVCPVRMLPERQRHIRSTIVDYTPLTLDKPKYLTHVEVLLEDHRAPVRHHCEERILTAKPPEEREAHPEPVHLAEVLPLSDVEHILDEPEVLEWDPLRGRGCP